MLRWLFPKDKEIFTGGRKFRTDSAYKDAWEIDFGKLGVPDAIRIGAGHDKEQPLYVTATEVETDVFRLYLHYSGKETDIGYIIVTEKDALNYEQAMAVLTGWEQAARERGGERVPVSAKNGADYKPVPAERRPGPPPVISPPGFH